MSIYVGRYGPDWKEGVLVDHVDEAVGAGASEAVSSDGWAVLILGSDGVYPIVCGDLIEIDTEDGPISGRCGGPVRPGMYGCAGHAAERDEWAAMSEAEKVAWEMEQEDF